LKVRVLTKVSRMIKLSCKGQICVWCMCWVPDLKLRVIFVPKYCAVTISKISYGLAKLQPP